MTIQKGTYKDCNYVITTDGWIVNIRDKKYKGGNLLKSSLRGNSLGDKEKNKLEAISIALEQIKETIDELI